MIIKGNERKRSRDYYHSVTEAPSALRSASICLVPSLFIRHPTCRFDSHRQIYRNFCFAFVLIFVEKEFSIFTSLLPRVPPVPFSPFNFSFPSSPYLILDTDPFIERQKLILATFMFMFTPMFRVSIKTVFTGFTYLRSRTCLLRSPWHSFHP